MGGGGGGGGGDRRDTKSPPVSVGLQSYVNMAPFMHLSMFTAQKAITVVMLANNFKTHITIEKH